MIELKSCPFCGGRANIVQDSTGADRDFAKLKFKIRCSKCNAELRNTTGSIEMMLKDGEIHIVRDDRKDIARMWNRRYIEDGQINSQK